MASRGGGRRNVEVDRISNLPNEVLTHILSFLFTDEAVQTCVLSKRWRYTWAAVPVLKFSSKRSWLDDSDGNYDEARLERLVNGVLNNRESTKLDIVQYSEWIGSSHTHMEWLDRVALLMPRLIHIYIESSRLLLPDLVFSCASLEHLTMRLYTVRKTIITPGSINLPSLKFLHLGGVELHDDFVQKLFEGCPSLKTLSFLSCDLYISVISSNLLRELRFYACRQFEDIRVSCSGLVSFFIDISIKKESISLENMTSLVNADIRLHSRDRYYSGDDDMPIFNIFGGLSNVTSLELSLGYPESKVLKKQLEKDVPNCRNFINLKKLHIGTWNMSCDFYLVACLLMHAPNLKELTLDFEDFYLDPDNTRDKHRKLLSRDVFCKHEFLEVVKIYEDDDFKLTQKLMRALRKTLDRHVKKIGKIEIVRR